MRRTRNERGAERWRTANGREVILTPGELNAILRYLTMNGTVGVQMCPGHIQHPTRINLLKKGIFVQEEKGYYFWAKGVWGPDESLATFREEIEREHAKTP